MEQILTIEHLISLTIGITAGIIANYIYQNSSQVNLSRREKKVFSKLEGWWVERIKEQEPERLFSIAKFEYDSKSKSFQYHGFNFKNNGVLHYKWSSKKMMLDYDEIEKKHRVLYIYEVDLDSKEGFGVSNINSSNKKNIYFESGYFLDARRNTDIRNITFYRAEKVVQKLGEPLNLDFDNYSVEQLGGFIKKLTDWEQKTSVNIF